MDIDAIPSQLQTLKMSPPTSNESNKLPMKPIPGDYGLPFFGAIKDRLDYFYNQGKDEFFSARIQKYQSTIFKTNMPPGPFIAKNPKVIAVLDAVSFPVLFDTSLVEKYNVLDGTFFPSVSFTGGYRACAYLDPSEPKHTSLKSFFMSTLPSKHSDFIPLFRTCLSSLFTDIEDEMVSQKKANFNKPSDAMSFNFVFRLLGNKDVSDTKLGSEGPAIVDKWLALQLAPLASLGLPVFFKYFEDILLRTFPLPFFFVKSDYKKLYDAFYDQSSSSVLEKAESFGITKEEACHNLVFLAGFNAYGGMKAWFPTLIKWVGIAGKELHSQLVNEIRTVVKEEGGVTFQALDKMSLTKSVVFEALRIDPPVPFQYGKAKKDMVVHTHDAAYEIKKGEMIFGYQPFATKDPRVFDNAEEFVGDRFVGGGEKLLKYVYWSNGRETEDPTVENKQCPGKDLVLLISRVFLVELFLRYDTFAVETARALALGSTVTFTSLTKATSI